MGLISFFGWSKRPNCLSKGNFPSIAAILSFLKYSWNEELEASCFRARILVGIAVAKVWGINQINDKKYLNDRCRKSVLNNKKRCLSPLEWVWCAKKRQSNPCLLFFIVIYLEPTHYCTNTLEQHNRCQFCAPMAMFP